MHPVHIFMDPWTGSTEGVHALHFPSKLDRRVAIKPTLRRCHATCAARRDNSERHLNVEEFLTAQQI